MEPESEPPNFLFIAPLNIRFSDDPETGWRSKVQLFENSVALGPGSAGHQQMREAGGGAFRHWDRTLCFTSSDGSDPRTNGFLYEVLYPWLFPRWVIAAFSISLWLGAAGLFGLGVLKAIKRMKSWLDSASKNEKIHAGTQICFACLIAIIWLWFVPPVFTSIDSAVLALYDLRYSTIPHYPILYPLFTRAILFGTVNIFHPELAGPGQWFEGNLTDEGLFLIGAVQMFLWTAAVLAFAFSLGISAFPRWLVLGLFAFCLPLYFMVLSISSEALWVSLLLFQFSMAVKIFKNPGWRVGYAWYSLAVALSILTRHAGIFLAGLLPLAFLLQWLFQKNRAASFKNLLFATGAIVLSIFVSKSFSNFVLDWLDVPNYSIFGRAAIYHLGEDWLIDVPDEQIEEIKNRLVQMAGSEAEKEVIRETLPAVNPWYGFYLQAHQIVSRHQKIPEGTTPEVDALLNRIMKNYFLILHPVHRITVGNALRSYFQDAFQLNLVARYLGHTQGYSDFMRQQDLRHYFSNLHLFGPDQLLAAHRKLPQRTMSVIGGVYRWGWILAVFMVLALIFLFLRQISSESAILNFSCLIALLVYLLAMSVVTVHVERYAISCLLFSICCLGLLISQFQMPERMKNE